MFSLIRNFIRYFVFFIGWILLLLLVNILNNRILRYILRRWWINLRIRSMIRITRWLFLKLHKVFQFLDLINRSPSLCFIVFQWWMIELLYNTLVLYIIYEWLWWNYLVLVVSCCLMWVRAKHPIVKGFHCSSILMIRVVNTIYHVRIDCALLHEVSDISWSFSSLMRTSKLIA